MTSSISGSSFQALFQEISETLKSAPREYFTPAQKKSIDEKFKELSSMRPSNRYDKARAASLSYRVSVVTSDDEWSHFRRLPRRCLMELKDPSLEELEETLAANACFIGRGENLNVLKAIKSIPMGEREEVSALAALFIAPHQPFFYIAVMLDIIRNIPLAERKEVCTSAAWLIRPGSDVWGIKLVLEVIRNIPSEEREEALTLANHFIGPQDTPQGIGFILEIIRNIPQKEREEVCILTDLAIAPRPENQDQSKLFQACNILKVVAGFPSQHRQDQFALFKPYIEVINSKIDWIFKTFENCFFENLKQIFDEVAPFTKDRNEQEVCDILLAGKNLYSKKRKRTREDLEASDDEPEDVLSIAGPFLRDGSLSAEALKRISEEPPEIRKTICKRIFPFFAGKCLTNIDLILLGAAKIPEEDFNEIFALIDHVDSDVEVSFLVETSEDMQRVSSAQKELIVKAVSPFFAGKSLSDRELVWRQALRSPLGEIVGLFTSAAHFMEGRALSFLVPILEAVRKISLLKRKMICEKVSFFLTHADLNKIEAVLLEVVNLLEVVRIPVKEFHQICHAATEFIKPEMNTSLVIKILKVIKHLVEKKQTQELTAISLPSWILELVKGFREVEEAILFIDVAEEAIKENSQMDPSDSEVLRWTIDQIGVKIGQLRDDEENLDEVENLCYLILENQYLLGIQEESRIFELVISTLSQIDQTSDNSYKVHKELLDKMQGPAPEVIPIQILGENIGFSFQALVRAANLPKSVPITFAELPQIAPNTFEMLFAKLENRIKGLSLEELAKVEEEISHLGDFQKLKKNCTDPGSHIYELMQAKRGPEEEIAPRPMVKLYGIAQHLSTLSDELTRPVNGQETALLLSEQERTLLEFAESVQYYCKIGQNEGFDAYYQIGLKKQAIYVPLDVVSFHEFIASLATHQLRRISGFFSSDNLMMREFTSTEAGSMAQLPHQSNYVKNLLCRDLKLEHDLTFDRSPAMISQELRAKTKEEVLSVFFKHYALDFVKHVQMTINQRISKRDKGPEAQKEANIFYNAVVEACSSKISPKSIFSLDEESEEVTVTDRGTLLLLKALHIF